MSLSNWLLVLCATPLVVAPLSNEDLLRLEPKEGRVLVKTFEKTSEYEAVTTAFWVGRVLHDVSSECHLVVRDEVTALDEGRTKELERTYDEISRERSGTCEGNGGFHMGEGHLVEMSEAEGETVTFSWEEEEEAYVASCRRLDRDQLRHLPYDYSFGALLPEGEISKGDEWEIAPEVAFALLNPWRGIPMEVEREHGDKPPLDDFDIIFEGNAVTEWFDGELVATYEGTTEVDGVQVAVIALEGEIEMDRTFELSTTARWSQWETSEKRSIEGEASWNLAGGHLHRLEVEVELWRSWSLSEGYPDPRGGEEYEETMTEVLEGKQVFSASFEELESSSRATE